MQCGRSFLIQFLLGKGTNVKLSIHSFNPLMYLLNTYFLIQFLLEKVNACDEQMTVQFTEPLLPPVELELVPNLVYFSYSCYVMA